MQLRINGKTTESCGKATLQELIARSVKKDDFIVAELNGRIIKKPDWGATLLNEGDTLELVTLYGGG
jgi:thiamine biosynthesis protein ThiS